MCLPTDAATLEKILSFIKIDYLTEAFQEIKTAWPNYIIAFVISIVICLIYFFAMRFFAGCVIWTIILGTLVGLFLGGGLLFKKY